ncbi:translation initiation factor eIF-2B subunit alpha [Coniosporium tulheliwenetii]|nr:translation initiation factor eIF-2B subunit alpha [Cladosporium sp. JES 115]
MLRHKGVPVATIPESAVAYALGKIDMVIVGAEGVVENGGIISRLGTYQIGMLAKAARKPFYVVAESHKFVRLYPLSQYDLPIDQKVIEFEVEGDGKLEKAEKKDMSADVDEGVVMGVDDEGKTVKTEEYKGNGLEDAVDFTPPDLISGIITESGVLTPSAVSEELIKIWF